MTYQERTTYTAQHHAMSAAQIWAAWRAGAVTMYHVLEYQRHHNIYFDREGNVND